MLTCSPKNKYSEISDNVVSVKNVWKSGRYMGNIMQRLRCVNLHCIPSITLFLYRPPFFAGIGEPVRVPEHSCSSVLGQPNFVYSSLTLLLFVCVTPHLNEKCRLNWKSVEH